MYTSGIRIIRSHEFRSTDTATNRVYTSSKHDHSKYDAFSHIGKDIVTKRIWYDK